MSKFLIADPVHIHNRNFRSLFDYLEEAKATVIINNDHHDWMSAFGNYSPFQDKLAENYKRIKDLTSSELFEFSTLQINVFKVARAEILSLAITLDDLQDQKLPKDAKTLLSLLLEKHRDIVLWNMAAAIYWIDFWSRSFRKHNPKFALVFSGSLIYARALLEFSKTHTARAFVLESFFTGNDNYIEEKYEPIANNSNLKHLAYYKSLEPKISTEERDRERNKAVNKIISAKNKNVTQPEESKVKLFKNKKPTILITGQVLNDFSVLEHNGIGLNSISFYTDLIEKILANTELNIVFKSHPWERKKKNITAPLTLDMLCKKFSAVPNTTTENGRLIFIEDFNIKSLFKQVDFISGINSQALIEAAFEGYQPIQFGNSFYGNKGFTSDYNIDEIDIFIRDINSGKVPTHLGIEGFRDYETFLVRSLQFSLVSAFPSGKSQLKNIFQLPSHVLILKTIAPGATPATPTKQVAVVKAPVPAKATVQPSTPTNSTATKPQQPTPIEKSTPTPSNKIVTITSETHEKRILEASIEDAKAEAIEKSKKQWQKFRKTPKKFFLDSKKKRIRWLHVFFPKKLSFSRSK